MMPQITLVGYHFTNLSIVPVQTHDPKGKLDGTQMAIHADAQHIEDGSLLAVAIKIKVDMERSINPPYDFTLEVIGNFSAQDIAELRSPNAVLSAANILIGVTRQMISMNTGCFPWGRFNIGIINLNKNNAQTQNQPRKAAPKTKKAKKSKK